MVEFSQPSFQKKRKDLFSAFKRGFRDFIPKSYICLKEGYSLSYFFHDLFAGVSVGIIALPLAMAFAIASGVSPEKGLFTAIIAGFLISLLGGSRVQIGGPTGAFIVVVYGIVQRHGVEGLAIATLLAGIMIAIMGLARFGLLLKFIPYPVTVGFTSGIAVVIFSSQIKDFFGLQMGAVPAEFVEKWQLYFIHAQTWNPWAFVIGLGTLGAIFSLKHIYPRLPGVIMAVIGATLFTFLCDLPIETIGKKFGFIPRMLPSPGFPHITLEKIIAVFPDAITIALLGAIESLLSAVVADGMAGTKHRPNSELFAQGIANIGSVIFGGIPATGAIARTTANIKMHAKTPVAGMIHALTLLIMMMLLAPLAALVPLPALAGVLVFIAWNMSEIPHFIGILKGKNGDALVLVTTFLLTVLVDLIVAVQVGVMIAALLFLKKMSESIKGSLFSIVSSQSLKEDAEHHIENLDRQDIPREVVVFEIEGPLFFGAAGFLNEALRGVDPSTKFFIFDMYKIPLVDATGIYALKQFLIQCKKKEIVVLLTCLRSDVKHLMMKTEMESLIGHQFIFNHLNEAIVYTQRVLEQESLIDLAAKKEKLIKTSI